MHFAQKIIILSRVSKFSVTSWIRSVKHNAAVGGVANSQYLNGLAVDIVLDDVGDQTAFTNAAIAFELEVIDEKTHLRVQEPR